MARKGDCWNNIAIESAPIAEEFFKAQVKRNQDTQNPPGNKLKDEINYASQDSSI